MNISNDRELLSKEWAFGDMIIHCTFIFASITVYYSQICILSNIHFFINVKDFLIFIIIVYESLYIMKHIKTKYWNYFYKKLFLKIKKKSLKKLHEKYFSSIIYMVDDIEIL